MTATPSSGWAAGCSRSITAGWPATRSWSAPILRPSIPWRPRPRRRSRKSSSPPPSRRPRRSRIEPPQGAPLLLPRGRGQPAAGLEGEPAGGDHHRRELVHRRRLPAGERQPGVVGRALAGGDAGGDLSQAGDPGGGPAPAGRRGGAGAGGALGRAGHGGGGPQALPAGLPQPLQSGGRLAGGAAAAVAGDRARSAHGGERAGARSLARKLADAPRGVADRRRPGMARPARHGRGGGAGGGGGPGRGPPRRGHLHHRQRHPADRLPALRGDRDHAPGGGHGALHPRAVLRRGAAPGFDRGPDGERRPLGGLPAPPRAGRGIALLQRPGARFPRGPTGGFPDPARRGRRSVRRGGVAAPGGVMKSWYQLFKLWWLAVLPLTKDAIHIYIGFVGLLIGLIVFRRRLSSYQALIPGLLVSLAMEFFDLRDGYSVGASVHDIINTNLLPFVLVTLARLQTFNF